MIRKTGFSIIKIFKYNLFFIYMQIICNSCLSNRIYKHILYKDSKNMLIYENNPFCHATWSPKTMINWIKHYKNIDYSKIKLQINTKHQIVNNDFIECKIDNLLTIYYTHTNQINNSINDFKYLYFKQLELFDINDTPIFILSRGAIFNKINYLKYSIKFNLMDAYTILLIAKYDSIFFDIDLPLNKTNYLLYVNNYGPTDIINNFNEFNNLSFIIRRIKESLN